ncbi:MAG: hypothetical protein ACRD8O_17545 [Bryobacteraceae bacterium]
MTDSEERKLRAGLNALANDRSEAAPVRIETALLAEFRRRRSKRAWRKAAAWGSIAAALVVIAVGRARREEPVRPSVPAVKPIELTQPPAVPLAVAAAASKPAPTRRPRRPAPPARLEVATGFFPVAGGDLLSPFDRGQMVRVRLPRSALGVFGLPFNEDRASGTVKADVLLGEDGMARAIRFVQDQPAPRSAGMGIRY